MNRTARRGFSLVELMTVVGIIMLLISILLPALGRAREMGRRTACLANLRTIAQGCIFYGGPGNNYRFPNWGQPSPGFASIGELWDRDNAAAAAANVVSNTRNIWMLVRDKSADPKTFVCPSDDLAGEAFQPADMTNVYDVQNRSQWSYSFQYQGPAGSDPANPRTGWNTSTKDDSRLVILADATPAMTAVHPTNTDSGTTGGARIHLFNLLIADDPALQGFVTAMTDMLNFGGITYNQATAKGNYVISGGSTLRGLNSANHRGEGQNVARLDGSAEFAANPWAGAHLDNIYTVQDPQYYDASHLNGNTQAGNTDMLRARMLGKYETGPGAYTELDVTGAWVSDGFQASRVRFPDSFLVP